MSPAEQLAASQLGWDEVCNLSLSLPPSLSPPASLPPFPSLSLPLTHRFPAGPLGGRREHPSLRGSLGRAQRGAERGSEIVGL